MCQAVNDNEQSALSTTFSSLAPNFPQHRILFYQSDVGKTAISRQLKPCLQIEYDVGFIKRLSPHIRKIIYLNSHPGDREPIASQEHIVNPKCTTMESDSTAFSSQATINTIEEILDIQLRP